MFKIKKIIAGYAYAKNGNVQNPTPRVRYDIYRDNRLIGSDSKLKAAKQFIADIQSGAL